MQSDGSESLSPTTQRLQSLSAADTRGKHRIQAELKRLEQEARFLEVSDAFTLILMLGILSLWCCCCCILCWILIVLYLISGFDWMHVSIRQWNFQFQFWIQLAAGFVRSPNFLFENLRLEFIRKFSWAVNVLNWVQSLKWFGLVVC